MDEQMFFDQNGVSVSNTRFIVNGQTYAMSAVTSVKSSVHTPPRVGAALFVIIGVLICLIGNTTAIVIGVLTLVCAIAFGALQKPEHVVVLSTSSGESQALKSVDSLYIESVVSALNHSIIHRG
jgi:uncharacterized membrane protein